MSVRVSSCTPYSTNRSMLPLTVWTFTLHRGRLRPSPSPSDESASHTRQTIRQTSYPYAGWGLQQVLQWIVRPSLRTVQKVHTRSSTTTHFILPSSLQRRVSQWHRAPASHHQSPAE